MENWKMIHEFPDYKINEKGNIKHILRPNYLQPSSSTGYSSVTLFKNGQRHYRLVHRLVAKAFISNPNNLPEINHIDGNKLNNNVSNLEWVTRSENAIHGFKTGLIKPRGQSITKDLQNKIISFNGKLSQRKIAEKLNTTFSIVNTTLKKYNS